MEDDNGLDLSLSLPCGGPSTSSKGKNGSYSGTRTDEGDRGSRLIDDFKNFLDGGNQKEDSDMGPQRSNQLKQEENLFYDLTKAASANMGNSTNLNGGGFWVGNENRSTEVQEERNSDAGNKRKNMFDEINHQKKHERETHLSDLHDKARTSHISITTDEGSTAENEDVADSEAEGSTSRLVQQYEIGSKRQTGTVSFSEGAKEIHGVSDSNNVDSQGQRRFTISSEKDLKLGNVSYGVPYPGQSVNILNMSSYPPLPVKDSNSNHVIGPVTSTYSIPGMIQVMPATSNERPVNQPVIPANLPVMFGYSPVQIPAVESGKSGGVVSHSLQFHPSYFGRVHPNSDKQIDGLKISQVPAHKSYENTPYDGRQLERAKDEGKYAKEEGSSSHTEVEVKGSSATGMAKNTTDQVMLEGFPFDYPAIKPGIAAELKFGGSGSSPNLPWVSTTGSGPNGRTISGVTYRYSGTQIRIVCACHGSHMSPEEFIQHAGEDHANANVASTLPSFPNSNPAASAQS